MPDDAWTAKADDREPRPWKEIPNVPQPFSQHRPSGGFAVPAECPIPAKEQTWQLETNGRRWVGSAARIAVTAGSEWLEIPVDGTPLAGARYVYEIVADAGGGGPGPGSAAARLRDSPEDPAGQARAGNRAITSRQPPFSSPAQLQSRACSVREKSRGRVRCFLDGDGSQCDSPPAVAGGAPAEVAGNQVAAVVQPQLIRPVATIDIPQN